MKGKAKLESFLKFILFSVAAGFCLIGMPPHKDLLLVTPNLKSPIFSMKFGLKSVLGEMLDGLGC